jgi:deoxyuridine 5'-triphosphate nucleotidohydrolase
MDIVNVNTLNTSDQEEKSCDTPEWRERLQVKLLQVTAKLPEKGSESAIGFDLYASQAIIIPAKDRALVNTGIAMAIPYGTYGRIASRSGLAVKYSIDIGAGVIDPDYRGEVKVLLINNGEVDFPVLVGERIAQLILEKAENPIVVQVDELSETERGNSGFGSTGKTELTSVDLSMIEAVSNSELLTFPGTINGHRVHILIDSGSKGNFISNRISEKLNIGSNAPLSHTVTLADGSTFQASLLKGLFLNIFNYSEETEFLIAPIAHDIILGKPWLENINPTINWSQNTLSFVDAEGNTHQWEQEDFFISAKQLEKLMKRDKKLKVWMCVIKDIEEFREKVETTTKDKPEYLKKVLTDFEEVFSGISGMPPKRITDHRIDIVEGSEPPHAPTYHMSGDELKLLKEELDRLLELGHIRPSISPFGTPVFFVIEKTKKIRMVMDYRALNKITIKNRTALPNILELLDRLKDAKIFTKIDLQSGYHLIRMAEKDIPKTAIKTKYGHYEWTVMPFGLCNAPATFQQTMNQIFSDLIDKCLVVYLDDILVFSNTHEDHEQHLKMVLKRMKENKLRARVHKCRFLQEEVDYLGYIISKGMIRHDPTKTEAIQSWILPITITELRSFLGVTNTLLRFVPMYAQHAAVLTDLLKGSPAKKDKIEWTPQSIKVFEDLKTLMSSPQNLHIPDNISPMIVHTDWSEKAIGGWIAQLVDGIEKPIAFESRKLRQAERNYSPYEGELLALVHCLRTFRPYLVGRKVILKSDQKALKWLLDQRILSHRQYRWLGVLQEYDLTLEWIKGSENTIADALSRRAFTAEAAVQVNVIPNIDEIPTFIEKVRQHLLTDSALQEIIQKIKGGKPVKGYTLHNDLLWYKDYLLVIPQALRNNLLHDHHDALLAGHPGVKVTEEMISRQFHWPNLHIDVESYVSSCESCQRNKDSTQRPVGLLKPLEIPSKPWESISMDFITHLPKSKKGNDSITVFVDRLTKMVHLVAGKTTDKAKDVLQQFIAKVVSQHGIPNQIVSDRDSKFTSSFWQNFMELLNVKTSMSSAFHPQTDGQTERMNRTLEQILRMYIDQKQTNWEDLLPIVEFAINNHTSSTTSFTPFFLNYGYHPKFGTSVQKDSANPSALLNHQIIQQNLEKTKDLIRKAQDYQKAYFDKKHRHLDFQVGDFVLLNSENITVDNQREQKSKKLAQRFIGPYKIIRKISPVAYELQMPESTKVHTVFHISKLKEYKNSNSFNRTSHSRPDPILSDGQEEWEVENLMDKRIFRGRTQYLAHWKGFDASERTWIFLEDLGNSLDLVEQFEDNLPLAQRFPS